ncbi:unnamed protein product [Calypogeia fissa]
MKEFAVETRGKVRQDKASKAEDTGATQDAQGGAAKQTEKKRGRPRKAENKKARHDDSDLEEHIQDAPSNGEEENPKTTKQPKKENDTDEATNANDYEKTAEEFEEFVQQLQINVSVEEIRALLHENGVDTLGSDEQLYQRSADLLFFGTCETCPSCGGALEFSGQSYQCSSYSTEWAKCNYSTAEGRKGGKAKLPPKLKSDFLKKWVKTHVIATRQFDPTDKPFSGLTFVLVGRMSRPQGEVKKEIEKYGGIVLNSAREGVTAMLLADQEFSRGGTSKLEKADDFEVPICRESWLNDSIEKMEAQPLAAYNFDEKAIPWDMLHPEDEAAEALVAELKLVGKRGVYKDTRLEEDGGKIYEKDAIIYNCALSLCDIHLDLNQYAVLQLIQIHGKKRRRMGDHKGDIYLYVKEGRVGDRRRVRERLDKQESPKAAMREFTKVFEELTGNQFMEWELEKKISKKRNKYFPLDMAQGVDARAGALEGRQLGVAALHSRVDSRVVAFPTTLFSQEVYRHAMSEIGVDAPDLPTGNLTDWHIEFCQKYLVEFCEYLKTGNDNEQKTEQICLDFSNKWFTLLHSTRPFIIRNLGELSELAAPTLETVRDISHASRLLGDMTGDTLDDPIADRYAKMKCLMTPLDREGDDFKMILNYFSKTMEPLKFPDGEYNVTVEDILELESKAGPSLEDIQKVHNRMLLWCGMRTSNLFAALHRGMLPAIINAPAPNYSFGKGIYFTDAAAKAAQYGFTAVDRPEGFLLLAIVGLEDRLELAAPEKPVKEYEEAGVCVKINGKKGPDKEEYIHWKYDVTVPCGTLKETDVKGVQAYMHFNEYVAYDPKKVKPMFLLKTRFEMVKSRTRTLMNINAQADAADAAQDAVDTAATNGAVGDGENV